MNKQTNNRINRCTHLNEDDGELEEEGEAVEEDGLHDRA